jgi:hypothetical protein
LKNIFLISRKTIDQEEDIDDNIEQISGSFLKKKLFSEFQEINALNDGHQNDLNLHGENIVKSDLSLKLSMGDIINLDSSISERFVFKLNAC